MEFSEVYPNELHISTRQPDSLAEFKNLNVKCCFDNARVASSVNILFLCILPSQLTNVIQDIKPYLSDKCIIYSFVTSASIINLKNFLPDCMCRNFMLKPSYKFTKNISEIDNKLNENWNFSQNVTDCLRNMDMVKITDPFLMANGYYFVIFLYYIIRS
jgi:pyrroline-5-carboxylate reductase